jgi:hypothetical protein
MNMCGMNDQVVFCTSLIDHDKQRYQNWIDYYTKFFDGCGVDLWIINDGPATLSLDLKGVELKTFDERLGRETVWIFPGWKRSFYHALVWLTARYKHVGHIESDCWITEKGKEGFLYYMGQEGYFTGYCPAYNFPEASLQIINSPGVRQYLLDKYSCVENWYENIDFELDLSRLKPTYILDGDRIEGVMSRMSNRFTFVSGTTYQDFERYYGTTG